MKGEREEKRRVEPEHNQYRWEGKEGEDERTGNRGEEMIDEGERRRGRWDEKWMEREMEEERRGGRRELKDETVHREEEKQGGREDKKGNEDRREEADVLRGGGGGEEGMKEERTDRSVGSALIDSVDEYF